MDAEQHAEPEHQEQAFRGAAPCAGELAFTVLQHPLVGSGDLAERVVEFAAARYYFALQKSDLLVIAGVEHGLRKMGPDGPEFVRLLRSAGTTGRWRGARSRKLKGAVRLPPAAAATAKPVRRPVWACSG